MAQPFFALISIIVALVAYRFRRLGRRPAGYPPGPPTLPLIGNIHLMPKENPHLQFQKWAEEYGPVYSLILGTQVMIVLSTDQAIKDLLDKRGGIYSSRPDMSLGRIVTGGMHMLLLHYGETWRMMRKICHVNLNVKVAKTYIPYQELENRAMLASLTESPDLFADHIRRYTNSLTTQMLFGFRTTNIDDPKLKQLYWGSDRFSEVMGSGTAAVLDLYPVLRSLPDYALPMRQLAKIWHKKEKELFLGHYLNVKESIQKGTAKPCLSVDLVRVQKEEGFSDDVAGYLCGALLVAGSDTTAATLIAFIQALILFPEVAQAAQEELDRVCGGNFPSLEDEPKLPYIRGCVKESFRWMPVAILGVNHAVICDDEYMGYTIPKGATVMCNVWAVHNDERRHPDPRRFHPARYANDHQTAAEAATNPNPAMRDHFVFGAGRRLCQGMHIAERSLFLAMARLLWAFDVKPAQDASGNNIIPDPSELTGGMLVQPKPFPARIIPRDEHKGVRVNEEWSKMGDLLDEELQWKVLPESTHAAKTL